MIVNHLLIMERETLHLLALQSKIEEGDDEVTSTIADRAIEIIYESKNYPFASPSWFEAMERKIDENADYAVVAFKVMLQCLETNSENETELLKMLNLARKIVRKEKKYAIEGDIMWDRVLRYYGASFIS
jgi:streptomycin 6-kinase